MLVKLNMVNLKLNPFKCKLFCREVHYLGYIISAKGVRTDPEKVSVVENRSHPEDLHQLSFFGLCTYYRKFVKDFSSIVRPLLNLTEA